MKLSFMPSPCGFLGLSAKQAGPPEKADVIVVPFGLEASVSYGRGTAKGPQAILKASHQVELFDEELWREPHEKFGLATLKPFPVRKKAQAAVSQIEQVIEKIVQAGKFPLTLGGEHSLTAGAIRPFVKRNKTLTILHFDAHADLRDEYDGERYSHAAAMRRCLDHPGVRLVSVGIRNISAGEIPFLKKNRGRIRIFWAKDMAKWRTAEIAGAVGKGPVYISFDLDGFDCSLMPATGTPEPGGLFWEDAMDIIRAVCRSSRVVGADVVELAPQSGLHACDFLAAKLCFKMLAHIFR